MTTTPETADTGRPRSFRLNLSLTLWTIPALALLIGLGVWQLERLAWKRDLIAQRTSQLSLPPVAIDRVPKEWESFKFRRVRAEGHLLRSKDMRLVARSYKGQVGVEIVTPLRLAGGGAVLVNRGWAPTSWTDQEDGAAGQAMTPVVGLLRAGGRPNMFTPDNDPAHGTWYFVDVPAMVKASGLTDVRPYVLEAVAGPSPSGYPVGGRTRTTLPNNHLQYALTWFALAVALAAIYIAFHLKRR